MGSKAPPPEKSNHDAQANDILSDFPPQEGTAANRLLSRIVQTLQISPDTLYKLPNAINKVGRPDADTAACESVNGECIALLQGFIRISDPAERRRILALVQEAAERS